MPHYPQKFATNLSSKLASRSRHVCIFVGAGAAKACGLPDVAELQERVVRDSKEPYKGFFAAQLKSGNLEQALSRVRRIAASLLNSLATAGANETILGLDGRTANELDQLVCQAIVKKLDVETDMAPMLDFAAWASRCDYHSALEIFTVNYDLLIERALEWIQIPYFDGFIGTITARFRTELVEPLEGGDCMPAFFTRLWKLHGSLNWEWDEKHKILRRGNPVSKSAAIYPSDTKYDESRRMPFVVLQDRFRRALHQAESLTLITGYSFSDEHLNEIIYDAASRRARSEIVVFCHSKISDQLVENALRMPNMQVVTGSEAILGGIRGDWEAPQDPVPSFIWNEGQFALRDFKHLASYLAKSAAGEEFTHHIPKDAQPVVQPAGKEAKPNA